MWCCGPCYWCLRVTGKRPAASAVCLPLYNCQWNLSSSLQGWTQTVPVSHIYEVKLTRTCRLGKGCSLIMAPGGTSKRRMRVFKLSVAFAGIVCTLSCLHCLSLKNWRSEHLSCKICLIFFTFSSIIRLCISGIISQAPDFTAKQKQQDIPEDELSKVYMLHKTIFAQFLTPQFSVAFIWCEKLDIVARCQGRSAAYNSFMWPTGLGRRHWLCR